MRLTPDRVAVVTGVASGIGRGLAEALAARGCRLALVDRDERGLEEAASQLRGASTSVSTHAIDVADRRRMEALPDAVLHEHGAVHLLVNNAGVSVAGPFAALSLVDWEWIVGVNFWGVIYGCHFFLPHLLRQEEAHVVNVASDFALVGFPTKTAYCATKFAVRGFSEALRAELHGSPVGLTCVYPGPVATQLVARGRHWDEAKRQQEVRFLERRGMPLRAVAEQILRGVERNRARVLIGPETRLVDWMKRLFPAGTDALVARLRRRFRFL
jgi:short-subunit dehydrogenase